MTLTTYLVIGAAILLALVLGAMLARWFSTHATPDIVQDAEKAAWSRLEELLEFVANDKEDDLAIRAATQRKALRAQNVADFKARVAGL